MGNFIRSLLFVVLASWVAGCNSAPGPASSPANSESGGGAWASSGGELLKDSQNPWWVINTKQVHYCIAIDAQGFSATPSAIRQQIQNAFSYWQRQFTSRIPLVGSGGAGEQETFDQTGIGAQQFTEVPCTGSEDLRFQFGYGTLSAEQLQKIKDPRSYVGITVRTDYDNVNLRGKGFIFIGSDRGPNRYNGSSDTVENAWSLDITLYLILSHELGHVFGLPHMGDQLALMSQQLPEALVSHYLYDVEQALRPKVDPENCANFFYPSLNYSSYIQPAGVSPYLEFLGVPASDKVVWVEFDKDTGDAHVESSPDETEGSPHTLLGKISGVTYSVFALHTAVMIRVDDQQKIFTQQEIMIGSNQLPYVFGPAVLDLDGMGGSYQSAPGRSVAAAAKPVFLHFSEGRLALYSVEDGQMKQILNFSPKSLLGFYVQ